MNAIDKIFDWAKAKKNRRLLHRYGGIQQCPWCRQIAQSEGQWRFEVWDRDPFLDRLTCGVCGGASLWRFEVGMVYIGPLDPPMPSDPAVPYYSIEHATLRTNEKTPDR